MTDKPAFRRPDGGEISAQPKPSTEMVWAICPYIEYAPATAYERCPEYEYDEEVETEVQRGCYTKAEEACRIVFSMQVRERQATPW